MKFSSSLSRGYDRVLNAQCPDHSFNRRHRSETQVLPMLRQDMAFVMRKTCSEDAHDRQ